MNVTGNPIALDTSCVIELLRGTPESGRWVSGFAGVCLPVPVIGELRYGALNSQRAPENLRAVEAFIDRCRVLPADAATAREYGEVRARLRRVGTLIPENDVWIAAICRQNSLALATNDRHFANVEGLTLVTR